MEIFDLPILCKLVRDVLFGSFLVDVCDHYNPPLDGWEMRLFRVAYISGGGAKTYIVQPWSRLWIPHGQISDLPRHRSRFRLGGERKKTKEENSIHQSRPEL